MQLPRVHVREEEVLVEHDLEQHELGRGWRCGRRGRRGRRHLDIANDEWAGLLDELGGKLGHIQRIRLLQHSLRRSGPRLHGASRSVLLPRVEGRLRSLFDGRRLHWTRWMRWRVLQDRVLEEQRLHGRKEMLRDDQENVVGSKLH